MKGLNVWPVGAAWLCQHLWEHARFTDDREFLAKSRLPGDEGSRRVLPRLARRRPSRPANSSAARPCRPKTLSSRQTARRRFWTWDRRWTSRSLPSFSATVLKRRRTLGIDDPFVKKVEQTRRRLAGPRIGADGRLLEWTQERKEREPGHRHLSHLYALHPGWQITPRGTPELARAARARARLPAGARQRTNRLEPRLGHQLLRALGGRRGGGQTSHGLIGHSTFPNLFDGHPSGKRCVPD